MWTLNDMLLKNQQVSEESKKKLKIPWGKWKWKTMVQNLWDEEKAVLRGKFMVSNNLNLHLKELEEEQTKPQISRNKEIIKIKEEINEK